MVQRSVFRLPKAFDKDLRLLMYSMLSRRVAMGFIQIVRAIYFALLGFSPVEIGVLLSIATFVSAIHHITFGYLSDKVGRKIFLLLGGFFATMRLVIFAVSSNFWILALGQGVGAMGEGAGAGQPVVSGYISDKTDIRERASIFSTLAVTNAIAATVGSLMAGLPTFFQKVLALDMVRAHSLLFWIGAFTSLISLVLIFPLKDVKTKKVNEKVEEQPADQIVEHRETKKRSYGIIAKFSLVRATSGVGWGFIESLMALYFFIQFGIGGEILGPVYAIARLFSIFSYLLVPKVVHRFGEISTIVASRLFAAGFAIAFSLANWLPLAIFLVISMRITIMFTMPIRQTFATGIVSPEETATAIGVSNFARMSLRTIAPTVAGYMFETISLTMPFVTGAALLVVNGFLFRTFFQETKK